jgi:hypothetical protein
VNRRWLALVIVVACGCGPAAQGSNPAVRAKHMAFDPAKCMAIGPGILSCGAGDALSQQTQSDRPEIDTIRGICPQETHYVSGQGCIADTGNQ